MTILIFPCAFANLRLIAVHVYPPPFILNIILSLRYPTPHVQEFLGIISFF